MIKFVCTLLLLMVFFMSNAQNDMRGRSRDYQQLRNELSQKNANYDQRGQFRRTVEILAHTSIATDELIDICTYFPNEYMRYKICLVAYPNLIDKGQFFKVYDLFGQLSFAMKLYHNTQARDAYSSYDDGQDPYYDGPSGQGQVVVVECNVPNDKFDYILKSIKEQSFRDQMKYVAKQYIASECFSMEQLKQMLTVFRFDDDRLDILMYAYDYVPYKAEMYKLRDSLSFITNQRKYDKFLVDRQ